LKIVFLEGSFIFGHISPRFFKRTNQTTNNMSTDRKSSLAQAIASFKGKGIKSAHALKGDKTYQAKQADREAKQQAWELQKLQKQKAHTARMEGLAVAHMERIIEASRKAIAHMENTGKAEADVRLPKTTEVTYIDAKTGKEVTKYVPFRYTVEVDGKKSSFTWDAAQYGMRKNWIDEKSGETVFDEWTERNSSFADAGVELPFITAQKALAQEGWYIRDESDPEVGHAFVVKIYGYDPADLPEAQGLWHGLDKFQLSDAPAPASADASADAPASQPASTPASAPTELTATGGPSKTDG
jgi:hypothetical protein